MNKKKRVGIIICILLVIPTIPVLGIQHENIAADNQRYISYDGVVCGDANGVGYPGFGNLSLADSEYLMNYLYRGGPAPVPQCVGDCNADGIVNVADSFIVAKYLYKGCDPPNTSCCPSYAHITQKTTTAEEAFNRITPHSTDNVMIVENTTAYLGAIGHIIYVNGSWNTDLGGYGIVLIYDPSVIKVTSVSTVDTVIDPDDFWLFISDYSYTPWYIKSAVLLTYSQPLSAGSGPLFKITVTINKNAPIGDTILDLVTTPGNPPYMCVYTLADGTDDLFPALIDGVLTITVLAGDANTDGEVSVGDVVYLINHLYQQGPAPYPLESGDVNNDGVINVGDVVYLINYLFRGGPAPV